ncbi:TIGR03899 family protein [Pseudocolwellia agarivorans]|uniref:TIGR03899 family protein n=1 Tax=Pseudocolwellia agarivorans TaxID=1911682 RepID=UPI003F885002
MDKDKAELASKPESNLVTSSTDKSTNITSETKTSESTSSFTSQKHLLTLARQYVLDGALIPEDKQMPLEERVIKRERLSRLRQQQNLESIVKKSLSYCPNSTSTTKADPDWFNRFTSLAEDISNNTMQDLWAKILAGEISHPGSFSLKSLTVFKSMSITDAKLLAKVCGIAVKDSSKKNIRIISGAYNTPGIFSFFSKTTQQRVNLNQCGLSYTELLSLADNHLIFMQEAESNELKKGEKMVFNFNGKNLTLTAKKDQCGLSFYKFTPVGSELALLISDHPNKDLIPLLESSLQSHFSVISS